jgi:hypothetical protein
MDALDVGGPSSLGRDNLLVLKPLQEPADDRDTSTEAVFAHRLRHRDDHALHSLGPQRVWRRYVRKIDL